VLVFFMTLIIMAL